MAPKFEQFDAGFFAVVRNAAWHAELLPTGGVLVRSPDARVAVTFIAMSPAPAQAGEPTSTIDRARHELARWASGRRDVKLAGAVRLVPGTRHPTAAVSGTETLKDPSPAAGAKSARPWWRRVFARKAAAAWRFWAIANEHMLVLASARASAEALEAAADEVRALIASVKLPNRDLLVGRRFTDAVAALARGLFPSTPVAVIDDAHLQFGADAVSLAGLQRRYLAEPDFLAGHVRDHFGPLAGATGAGEPAVRYSPPFTSPSADPAGVFDTPESDRPSLYDVAAPEGAGTGKPSESAAATPPREWHSMREHIMPTLVSTDEYSRLPADVVAEEWVNDMYITYLFDDRGTTRHVTTADLRRWRLDAERLHEQAISNLVTRSHEITMEGSRTDGYTMLALSSPDVYNSARVLLPDLHKKLKEHLGQTFYAAMPNREFLLAFSTDREDVLGRVRQQVASDFAKARNPLTPKLFLVTPDGIAGDPQEAENYSEWLGDKWI